MASKERLCCVSAVSMALVSATAVRVRTSLPRNSLENAEKDRRGETYKPAERYCAANEIAHASECCDTELLDLSWAEQWVSPRACST